MENKTNLLTIIGKLAGQIEFDIELNRLTPDQRVMLFMELMKYCRPSMITASIKEGNK